MANICSIDLKLRFSDKISKSYFINDFQEKINIAEAKGLGVEIAENKTWLFDACIDDIAEDTAVLRGWVRWSMEYESIRMFTDSYLVAMNVVSFKCCYEETGNRIYGEFIYDGNGIADHYIDESHPVWEKPDTDFEEYFNELDKILKNDGVFSEAA